MNLSEIRQYQTMMADDVRMRAYQSAIRESCPGRVVCEVGLGLGPLTLMALEAGATRVYGIEALPRVLETATSLIRSLGYDERRFVPVLGKSWDVALPERVDVVVSETLDSLGLGENTVATMSDAATRFLKPGGVLIPSHLTCAVALAAPAAFAAEQRFWSHTMRETWGLDYSALAAAMRQVDHTLQIGTAEVFSRWTPWQEIDLRDARSLRAQTGFVLEVQRAGHLTGVATAFVAAVGTEVLNTFPGQPGTHWHQGFMPLPQAVDAQPGDLLVASVTLPEARKLTVATKKRFVHVPAAQADAFRNQLATV